MISLLYKSGIDHTFMCFSSFLSGEKDVNFLDCPILYIIMSEEDVRHTWFINPSKSPNSVGVTFRFFGVVMIDHAFGVMYIQYFSGHDRCDLDSYLVICQLLQKKSGWDKIVSLRHSYKRRFHCFESRVSGIRFQLFWSLKKFNFEKLVHFNQQF